LPGIVPRRRTAFARVKIEFVGIIGEAGVFVGVEGVRLLGEKRETVRFTDTGVNGRPGISSCSKENKPVLVTVDFLGVVGGIFSLSSTFPRLVVLEGLDASATILSEISEG
jgi:hypothetical protein